MSILTTLEQITPFLTIDNMIVIGFLCLTLVVGICSGRNIKDMRDYAIANKSYATPVLVMTLLATEIGGGATAGDAAEIFKVGIIHASVGIGATIASLLIAYWIAPKFVKVPESCLSVADVIEHYYGKHAALLTAMIGVLYTIGMVCVQMIALGYLFETYFNFPFFYGLMIGGGIVTFYATLGGIKAVTMTDVLQFTILIVMIPIVTNIATNQVGGIEAVFHRLDSDYLRVTSHPEFKSYFYLFLICIFPFRWFSPPVIQRMLMARDAKQIQNMFVTNAFIRLCLIALLTLLSFSVLILFPEAHPKAIIPTVINQLLPVAIKGIAISGVLAVLMSTIDSHLNAGSTLLTHNLIVPLFKASSHSLMIVRLSTLTIGISAMFLASYDFDLVPLAVAMDVIWAAVVATSFAFALLLSTPSKRCFYTSALASVASLFFLEFLPLELSRTQIQLIALIAGVLVYLITFYTTILKRLSLPSPSDLSRFYAYLLEKTQMISSPPTITASFKPTTPLTIHTSFAIFCLLNYMVPYYMWSYGQQDHLLNALVLRSFAGMLCVGILLKDYLFKSESPWFGVYWNLTLLVCLPLTTSYMYLIHEGATEWLINGCLAIFLLASLTHWKSFLSLTFLGIVSGAITCWLTLGAASLTPNFEKLYLGLYVLIFATLVSFLFNRKRELSTHDLQEKTKILASSMAHELKSPMMELHDALEHCTDPEIHAQLTTALKQMHRSSEMLLMSLKKNVVATDTQILSMRRVVQASLKAYHLSDDEQTRVIFNDDGADFTFKGSFYYMEHVLFNLLSNALYYTQHKQGATVTLWIEGHHLYIRDTGEGISKKNLPHIFEPFYSKRPAGTGVGLSFCQMVASELGGALTCTSELGQYTEFSLALVTHNLKSEPAAITPATHTKESA